MLSYLLSSWSLMPISYMNYLNPANSGDDVPDVSGFGRFLATQQSHASGKVRETSRWKSQKRSRVITTIASGKPHIGTITRLPLPKKFLSPSNFCGMLEPKCVGSRAIPPEVSWFPWNQKVFGWISLSNRIGKSQGFFENWGVALWTRWFVINWSHSNLGVIPQFQPQPSTPAFPNSSWNCPCLQPWVGYRRTTWPEMVKEDQKLGERHHYLHGIRNKGLSENRIPHGTPKPSGFMIISPIQSLLLRVYPIVRQTHMANLRLLGCTKAGFYCWLVDVLPFDETHETHEKAAWYR